MPVNPYNFGTSGTPVNSRIAGGRPRPTTPPVSPSPSPVGSVPTSAPTPAPTAVPKAPDLDCPEFSYNTSLTPAQLAMNNGVKFGGPYPPSRV